MTQVLRSICRAISGYLFPIAIGGGFTMILVLMTSDAISKGGGGGRSGGGGRGSSQQVKPSQSQPHYPALSYITRQEFVMANGLDSQYRQLFNPLIASQANIASGKRLYKERCMNCHGTDGLGDGERRAFLSPPPADLTKAFDLPVSPASYQFWTLSLGGARFNTQMPRFKKSIGLPSPETVLEEREIWQLIHYLQILRSKPSTRRNHEKGHE